MREFPNTIRSCLKRHEIVKGMFGEIYVTNKLRFIFHCTFCLDNFDTILAYKKHILSKHYDNVEYDDEEDQITEELEIVESLSDKTRTLLTDNCNEGKDPLEEIDSELIQPIVEFTTNCDDKWAIGDPHINRVKSVINKDVSICEPYAKLQVVEFNIKEENVHDLQTAATTTTTVKRKFKCDDCDQCFEHKQSLSNHKRVHSKRLKYSCTQCAKKFTRDNELKMHLLWHSGERPYICSWCGKDYRTARALHIHERLHTNTRPYKCPYCERDFYKNRHLKEHVVTHTRERNHMCHICNSSFPRRKALKSHIKLHVIKREHVCNICQVAYNQRPALYFHMKNKHNVLPLTTTKT